MNENEALISALEKIKAQKVNFGFMERFDVDENWEVMKALEEIQQYRAIGTVEELQALKEKSEPKKPIELDQWGEYYKCPICGKYAVNDFGCKYKFCPNCGTEFDWQ